MLSNKFFALVRAGIVAALCTATASADVTFEGLSAELESNARAILRLDEQACDAPVRRIEAEFEGAPQEIRTALEAYGYYAPEISSALEFTDDCWLANFVVSVGERVQIREARISVSGEAQNDQAFLRLLEESSVISGEPLLHGDYEALKQALRALALERGYRDASFAESAIDVFPEELAADVVIRFDTGQRYQFGEIQLDEGVLNRTLLSSYVDVTTGEPYDSRRLAEARLELINSGYFDGVFIEPDLPNRDTREIPVRIRLVPSARTQINYGFGLSTDTGPRFRFGRSIRRLNAKGHQLTVNGLFSPVVIEASTNYRMPYGDPRSEWVSFDLGGIREETDTATGRSLQFGARRVVAQSALWTRTDLLGMQVEDFDVGSQSGRARLLMPGVEWVRLDSDDAIRPNRGSRVQVELRGASDSLGSDTSFVQLTVSGKWIWPVREASRLIVRSEAGRIWFDNFTDLPPSIRYFAGGDYSVRGFDFETLGPVNELGEVIGGSRLFTASIEFEKQLKPAWSIAFFSDAGNAFSGADTDLRSSAGIGARWQSPLGPVRIDLAKPLDGDDRGVRLHLTLGPDL